MYILIEKIEDLEIFIQIVRIIFQKMIRKT